MKETTADEWKSCSSMVLQKITTKSSVMYQPVVQQAVAPPFNSCPVHSECYEGNDFLLMNVLRQFPAVSIYGNSY
jgi:hypothetical protein